MTLKQKFRNGFTLIELLVAVGITATLLAILVALLGNTSRSWRLGTAKLATNSEAALALDSLAIDLQNAIFHNTSQEATWIEVEAATSDNLSTSSGISTRTPAIRFFSPVVDREALFDPDINTTLAGDICAVSYRLAFQDPLPNSTTSELNMFGMYREVKNPQETLDTLLGKPDLGSIWGSADPDKNSLAASNIFHFTVSWIAQFPDNDGDGVAETLIIPPTASFRATAKGIFPFPPPKKDPFSGYENAGAKIIAAQINITVLDDAGAGKIRAINENSRTLNSIGYDDLSEFIDEHGYQFSRLVPILSGI